MLKLRNTQDVQQQINFYSRVIIFRLLTPYKKLINLHGIIPRNANIVLAVKNLLETK